MSNEYKVKLVSSTDPSSKVIFDVTPDLIETRNVNYKTVDPVHMPGQVYVYSNTSSRSFSLSNARLVSRTEEEATKNLKYTQILRSWTTPKFGKSSPNLGAPPDVLYLSAYNRGTSQYNINKVPVVIQQLGIPYPSDVDYIYDKQRHPVPTIMTVDIILIETHAPLEYEDFDLSSFKQGRLSNF